jgi:adenine-specific DNA-methyltransferase
MIIEKIEKKDNLSQSANIVQNNINKLKTLFPEIVTEGKIDFKALQQVLGEELEEAEEYYRFTWAGQEKKEALLVAQEIIGKKRVMVLEERRNMMV